MSQSTLRRVLTILVISSLLPAALLAQKDRIPGEIDARRTALLKGNVRPQAQAQFDQGPVDPAMELNYVTLTLKTSSSQQQDLDRLLTDLQDPFSPNFRKWLTPEQYAARFGASPGDLDKIVAWMKSEGFDVIGTARGRRWVAFNATAQQIRQTLHTEIRRYRVDGELHFANATEPSVPEALQPMVLGFLGLDDFHARRIRNAELPLVTNGNTHTMAPGDFATIYDMLPLYRSALTGAGLKIAVIARSNLKIAEFQQFRSTFGVGGSDPHLVLVPGTTDPGIVTDNSESNLDTQWASALAPGAQIVYVFAPSEWTAVAYAIDQNLGQMVSFSYYACELLASSVIAGNIQAVAQQGNSQGITWLAASGDVGAEGCDYSAFSGKPGTHGVSPSIYSATPEITGVGGTTFAEGNGVYWGPANGYLPTAFGYIPETAWVGSGGGYSTFFSTPAWQTGVAGVPRPGTARGAPDIAMTANGGHDPYLFVNNGQVGQVGGTSAPTPALAGVLALLNQYLGTNGLGNINPNLYRLAQSTANVFHDITTGNNFTPCVQSTPDCPQGRIATGYGAGPGWDPVTGLGSIDIYNLFAQWNKALVSTTTSVAASPNNFLLSDSTKLTVTVAAAGSAIVPAGTVSFTYGQNSLGSATLAASGANATATLTVYGSQLPAGTDTIQASYGGDGHVNGSTGSVNVTVTVPVTNSAIIPSITPNPVYQEEADADGYGWFYTVSLKEVAGASTTLTGFTIDGTDYSSAITDFFGSAAIPANGTLEASLRAGSLTVPAQRVYTFTGKDAGGRQWTQQITVPFYGMQISAAMEMVGLPATVRKDPAAASGCQWFQNLGLQEKNGHNVRLTRFLAGGADYTSSIQDFFGSTTLPAFGSLFTQLCWSIDSPPQTHSYEMDGIDDAGNQIVATETASFTGPAAKPGVLSTSADPNGGVVSLSVPDSSKSTAAPVTVNVNPGQAWTLSIFPSNRTTRWLVVTPLSGTGPATLNIAAFGSGLSDGSHQATLVVQSVDALPESVNLTVNFVVGLSLDPVVSTGAAQSYTFQFSGAAGYQSLSVVNVLINNSLDGRQACYLAYSVPDNVLYLVPDSGGGLLPGLVLNGSGGTGPGNSQCAVSAAGSSASGSGNTLTLALSLSFSHSFGGNKVIYLAARDAVGNNSGWQTMGIVSVPPLPSVFPSPVGVSPSSGTLSNATLTFTYQDASSANNLQTMWVLINTSIDGRGACYVAYYAPGNLVYLYPDNGFGLQAANVALTGANSLSNSQCTVSALGSTVVQNGAQTSVTLNITFSPSFAGNKGVWMAAQTLSGATSQAWQALGTWNVPGN